MPPKTFASGAATRTSSFSKSPYLLSISRFGNLVPKNTKFAFKKLHSSVVITLFLIIKT